MNCDVYQDRILDYEQLTAAEREAVDAHLQVCPECLELAQQWRVLDAALAQQMRAPALSAGFDAQVRRRIASEPTASSSAVLAEKQRALEMERAIVRPRPRRWIPQLLDVLGFGVAGGLGGWLLLTLLTRVNAAWNVTQTAGGPQMLIASSILGMILALGLVTLACHRPLLHALFR